MIRRALSGMARLGVSRALLPFRFGRASALSSSAALFVFHAAAWAVVALHFVDNAARRASDSTRARTDDSANRTTDNSPGHGADGGAGRLLLGGARCGQQAQGGDESEFLRGLFLQASRWTGRRTTPLARLSSSRRGSNAKIERRPRKPGRSATMAVAVLAKSGFWPCLEAPSIAPARLRPHADAAQASQFRVPRRCADWKCGSCGFRKVRMSASGR